MDSLHQIIREAQHQLIYNDIALGKYVSFSHYETVETITAYTNSKHISGSTDSLGREKPFFNIVNAAVNVWYHATDLDRKDIRFIATKTSSVTTAFVANVLLQRWMDSTHFGQFLNQWGYTLSQYGSAVVKFVEKNGKLEAKVIPWNRMIVDQVDFDAIPHIEKFYLTKSQLLAKKNYNKEVVDSLLTDLQSRENLDGTKKDNNPNFIPMYEVHGVMPKSLVTGKKEDEKTYVQQMHIVSYTQDSDGYNDFTLFSGTEARDPYMITHLKEEDARTISRGAVEELFESQWMVNHNVKNIKDTLDIASRLIFQTADKRYVGRNVLSSIESGDIFIHEDNRPLTRIANDKPDIQASQNFITAWQNLSTEISSTPDALRGNTLPAGTPYSLGAFLGTQASSIFRQYTESKGLHLEEMMRKFVIPNLQKKLNNKDEIVGILDDAGIDEIDTMYVPRKAIKRFNEKATQQILDNAEAVLNGQQPTAIEPFNADQEQVEVKQQMSQLGNKRFFKPDELGKKDWSQVFSDFEWDSLRVEVSGENVDKQSKLQTLAALYQTAVQTNPAAANVILGEVLQETNVVSPLRLKATQTQPAQAGNALKDLPTNTPA